MERKNFSITKVKECKNGGLDVHYEVIERNDTEVYTNKYHIECSKDIHPDLKECFNRIRPMMAQVVNYVATDDEQTKDVVETILAESLEVRGISLSGKHDAVGVVIACNLITNTFMKIPINSPRIKLSSMVYGFEEELNDIIPEIEDEVYKFLFEDKHAELEVFG